MTDENTTPPLAPKDVLGSVKPSAHPKLFEALAAYVEADFDKLEKILASTEDFIETEVKKLYHALGYGRPQNLPAGEAAASSTTSTTETSTTETSVSGSSNG